MQILLDEQIDKRLGRVFPTDFTVLHVHAQGWSGIKNGELLRRADNAFDALVTMDKNLIYQQNLSVIRLGIVVVRAVTNRLADVEPLTPDIVEVLRALKPAQVISVGPLANR